jgi:hypothetical protein
VFVILIATILVRTGVFVLGTNAFETEVRFFGRTERGFFRTETIENTTRTVLTSEVAFETRSNGRTEELIGDTMATCTLETSTSGCFRLLESLSAMTGGFDTLSVLALNGEFNGTTTGVTYSDVRVDAVAISTLQWRVQRTSLFIWTTRLFRPAGTI